MGQRRPQRLPPGLLRGLQPPQQGVEIGHGGQAVELDTLLFQGPDLGLHLLAAPEQLGLDGAGGDLQQLRDLPDAELLVVAHTQDQVLLRGQLRQDLPHQAGALLPVQRQLRLGLRAELRQLRQLRLLPGQVCKGQRQLLRQLVGGDVDGDAPQPGQKGLVGLQLAQILEGPQIAVLHNIPGQVLLPDHGPDGTIEDGTGDLIQLGEGGLIPCLGPGRQLRRQLSPGIPGVVAFFHALHLSLFWLFFHNSIIIPWKFPP